MWKWKEPVKLKSIRPMQMYSNTLNTKIPANYQFMYCRMDAEELLHVFSLPPEYTIIGGSQEQVFQNNLYHNTQLQIEFINQFLNRISLEGKQYLSYQDKVFITTLLNRVGIKNQQGFIRQLRLLFNERNLLTKLSNISQNEIQKQNLESKIYKRIHLNENVQKLFSFLQHTQSFKDGISFQEAQILEQQRQIDNRVLTELKEKFLKTEENISLLECGMYTLQKEEKKGITEKDIITNLSATILLNLADMAKCIISKKETNSFMEFNKIICAGTKLYAETFFAKNKTHIFSDYKVLKQLNQTKEILADVEIINFEENKSDYSIMEKNVQKVWESKEYLDLIDQKNKEMHRKIKKEIENSEDNIIIKADKKEIRKQALRALENQEEVLQEALTKTNILQTKDNQKEIEKYLLLTDETKRAFYHNLLNTLYVEDISNKKVLEKIEQRTASEKIKLNSVEQELLEDFEELLLYKENNNSRETKKTFSEHNNALEKYWNNMEEFTQNKVEGLKQIEKLEQLEQRSSLEKIKLNSAEQEHLKDFEELLLYKENNNSRETEKSIIEQNNALEEYWNIKEEFIQKKVEELRQIEKLEHIEQRTESEKIKLNSVEQEHLKDFEELLLYKENNNNRETEKTISEQNDALEEYWNNKEEFIQKKVEELRQIEKIKQRTATEKIKSNSVEQEHLKDFEELLLYKENNNSRETEKSIIEQNNALEEYWNIKEEFIQKKVEELRQIEKIEQRTASEKIKSNDVEQEHFEELEKLLLYKENNINHRIEKTISDQNNALEENRQNQDDSIQKKIEELQELEQRTASEKTEIKYAEQENSEELEELLIYKENNNSHKTEKTISEQNNALEEDIQNQEEFIQKKIEELQKLQELQELEQRTASEKTEIKYAEQENSEELEELLIYKENNNSHKTEKTISEQNNALEEDIQNQEEFIQKKIEELQKLQELQELEQRTASEKTEIKYGEQEYLGDFEEQLIYKENNNSSKTEKTIIEQNNTLENHEHNQEQFIQKKIEEITQTAQRTALEKTELNDAKIHSVEFVHKLVQNSYDQEEIKKILQDQITSKNKITQDSIVQNQRFITEVVAGNMQAQIGQLSDQVYHRIEKRLQNERKRRGF